MSTLILRLVLGLGVFSNAAFASELSYPKLFFSYSWLYDGTVCAAADTAAINSAWAAEAKARESDFTKMWERDAAALFGQLFKDFKRAMSRKELTATLSVCPAKWSWSYSDPLVLKASHFLRSYQGEKPVRPDHAFVDLVFHELLHTWLVENFSESSSALLVKYKDESPRVRSHLHLMAVQKHVYQELGREDLLKWIGGQYPRMTDGYARAWEIVNAEGVEGFVEEVRGSGR